MHVNRLPFLHTFSKDLKFRTILFLLSETKESLKDAISEVIVAYCKGGFVVKYMDVDGQFEWLKNIIHDIDIDICDIEDYANAVEWSA